MIRWKDERPPLDTWIVARYEDDKPEYAGRVVRHCKRGCCVIHPEWGCMVLPDYWRLATDAEVLG